jgi:uncharacterized repeat protein (TIGR04138 family)
MPHEPEKPLEQIVREVGKYAFDAYIFVQECIGLSTQRVHGPMSSAGEALAKYMVHEHLTPEELVARYEDEDLTAELMEAVREVGGPEKLNRHVTGQQLCEVIRDTALERWGLMARGVLARWGITRTEDLGEIVFALVNNGWLQKQPTDSIRDFDHVFSFEQAFDQEYRVGQ